MVPNVLAYNRPPVNPLSVVPYFDCIRLWLRQPVSARVIKKLHRLCGKLYCANKRGRWDGNFRQRLTFFQPTDEAIRWIAARRDGFVNHVQLTFDLIYVTPANAEAARDYLDRHRTRRWHRRSQGVKHYKNDKALTRYDGPAHARNTVTDYLEDYSRITGQPHCLHVEWRAEGVEAVRAAGVSHPRHCLNFDHRAFWQARLLLYAVDEGRLGRLFNNRQKRTRRHRITGADRARGRRILWCYDTMQELIDGLGPLRISHVLTPLDPEPYLPGRLYQFPKLR
jgi:hypothetical protein